MRLSALKYGILSVTAVIVVIVLLFMPLHAFLSVWLSSHFGHYTALRLWKEWLLAVAALGALFLILFDKKVRLSTLFHELTWLIIAYALVQLLWGAWALKYHHVNGKALAYGLLINLRFLVFFLVAWAVGSRSRRLHVQWSKLLVWPALVVVGFGLLQIFVLPTDFLRHFGYNDQTIFPYETINHNAHYIRIMSTLRGANPLGAYLLIPLSGLLVLMSVGKRNWRRAVFVAALLVVLFFSFSRGAWIGAILVAGVVALTRLPRGKQVWVSTAAGILLIIIASVGIALRHNTHFQNIVFHTQEHSSVKDSSNSGHVSAVRTGLHQLAHEPLGRGPGTAGPASIYNNHSPRIAENYYIQLGQEVGWLGLALFVGINIFLGWLLWQRRSDPLALTLLASLVGISFVNLVSHAWADDTLAYVWWGLAGIAIANGRETNEDSPVQSKH